MQHKQYMQRRLTKVFGNVLNKAVNLMTPFQVFKAFLKKEGVNITESKYNRMNQFVQLLMKKNEELNLTRITSEEEVWIKHIFDSLIPTRFMKLEKGMKVLDLGTGGGIPGIPLAILYPSVEFVLVDSVQKKAEAIKEFVKELGLRNVKVIAERAEALGRHPDHRDQYDYVLSRALAALPVLIEYCVPLIHLYGHVAAYKGPDYMTELLLSKKAVTKLQAEPPVIKFYNLPNNLGQRTLILITKKRVTPDHFPRRVGVPKKDPL